METPPGFNLDHAVAAWRAELARQPGLTPADLRELEAHLRDGFAELRKLGLRDEEAFMVSRLRVGPAKPVAQEFAKAAPQRVWARRLFWLCFVLLALQIWQTCLAWYGRYLYLNIGIFDPGMNIKTGMFRYYPDQGLDRIIDGVGLALPGAAIVLGPLLLAFFWRRGARQFMTRIFSARGQIVLLGAGLLLIYFMLRQFLAVEEMFAINRYNLTYWNGLFSNGVSKHLFAAWPEDDLWGMQFDWIISRPAYDAGLGFLWPLCLITFMIWLTPGRAKTKAHPSLA